MKKWIQATGACLAALCVMSWLDDGYDVQAQAQADLIEAQRVARIEAADAKLNEQFLLSKAAWMTNQRGMK